MGRVIVTNTEIAKIPYRMKETGHSLYTYEELCYYIRSRLPLWLLEEDRKGLTDWVRERGVMLLHTDQLSPAEAAEQILSAGSYLRQDEVEQVMEEFAAYESQPARYQEKKKGDIYLFYGKLLKAYFAYEKAVRETEESDDAAWRASLYHNMGLISCRFFYWEEAQEWFEKAMELRKTEETKTALHLVRDMKEKKWEYGSEPLLTIELERKKKEFLEELR